MPAASPTTAEPSMPSNRRKFIVGTLRYLVLFGTLILLLQIYLAMVGSTITVTAAEDHAMALAARHRLSAWIRLPARRTAILTNGWQIAWTGKQARIAHLGEMACHAVLAVGVEGARHVRVEGGDPSAAPRTDIWPVAPAHIRTLCAAARQGWVTVAWDVPTADP